MSFSHYGGRRSWRVLCQLRQRSTYTFLPRPPSTHLRLQNFRLHDPYSISSSSCLHHFYSSDGFGTAAEAAHMANCCAEAAHIANSAEPEATPPNESVSEKHEAAFCSNMVSDLDGVHEENTLKKMLEEHRELVSTLKAELEDQKILTRSILDEIRILKLSVDAKTAESKVSPQDQLWPEWTAFMEHLQSSDFFKDEKRVDGGSVFEDPACVRRAIYKFSQAHDSVFESLSLIDLRIIARHANTAKDPKSAASQKRLCQFFHIEDSSSDVGVAKPAFTQPKLSDVTRLLYSTVLEPVSWDEVKSSISHLLREIVTFSKQTRSVAPPAAENTFSSKPSSSLSVAALAETEERKQGKEKHMMKEKEGGIQKIGNAKGEEAVKIAAKAEARLEPAAGAPLWKCPRCSFMNLDTKHRCVECSRRRPRRTYGSDTVKSADDISAFDADMDVKTPVEERKAKKAHEKTGSLPTQGRKNAKDHSSSMVIQELDTTDVEDDLLSPSTKGCKKDHSSLVVQEQDSTHTEESSGEVDIGSEGSEAFNVLDDILDSDDSDDEQHAEGEIAGLSDHSEEEKQGNGRRAALSKLFPKLSSPSSRRDDPRGSNQRNGKKTGYGPSKGRRREDDDDNRRSRYGSLGNDEQGNSDDDDSPPLRLGRGRDDSYSRKPSRGGYNNFRERGSRGYGGGRGDSFDNQRSDGVLRGGSGSSYGNRDRGGRSSSYGSKPFKGKPSF